MRRILVLFALLIPIVGFADYPAGYPADANYYGSDSCCYDTCYDPCWCLGVEYLYMKASIYDPYFLIPERPMGTTNTNEPFGTRKGNFMPYTSGVRVYAGYNLCENWFNLWAEGVWLEEQHTRDIFCGLAPPNLCLGTKGHPLADTNSVMRAISDMHYCFYSVKGGVQYCFNVCDPFFAAARFDIHYASIDWKELIDYDESGNFVFYKAKMDSWAVGPEVGFDVGYKLFSCFSVVMRGSYGLLVGEASSLTETRDVLDGPPPTLDDLITANNEENVIVVPVGEIKVGLLFDWNFWCFNTAIEVGYDIIRYTDFLDHIRFIGDRMDATANVGSEGDSFDHYSPFMVHGLYVSLKACF